MAILFIRAIITYILVFVIIRLTGKRQISELQPFDLVVTLLIADLASEPISNLSTPLTFGVVPIIALFLMQKLVSKLSLKSQRFRTLLCGSPLVLIHDGVISEEIMRQANYTLCDLMEQLRNKDVFNISDVYYAILETNGSLSVLLHSQFIAPTRNDLNVPSTDSPPSVALILDGKREKSALSVTSVSNDALSAALKSINCPTDKYLLFAILNADNILHIQYKRKFGGKVEFVKIKKNP